MRRSVAALAVGMLVAAGALVGCSGEETPGLMPAAVDVDTPQLRQLKADLGVADCPSVEAAAVAGGLPDLTLPCLGGGRDVAISGLRGPLVVNVWASWCGPCRTEMPVLQRFHESYAERVPIIGVDYEDVQVDAALDLVRTTGVTYPLVADPQSLLQGAEPFPGRMGLPLFAFVAPDGTATVVAGGVESLRELVDLVDVHLGVEL